MSFQIYIYQHLSVRLKSKHFLNKSSFLRTWKAQKFYIWNKNYFLIQHAKTSAVVPAGPLYFYCCAENQLISPSTSTSLPTTGSVSRLWCCCNFFLDDFECGALSRSFSFLEPLDECGAKGILSASSFSGDMMSFIFSPSASRSVSGSSLAAPPWNREDFEDEECFFEEEEPERDWEKEWLPLLPLSRFRSLEECEDKDGYEGFLCRWGLGSEPVARGEVMACKRPIAVSTGREDSGEDTGGERSADLCFFLCGGGPKPSWSDRVERKLRTI